MSAGGCPVARRRLRRRRSRTTPAGPHFERREFALASWPSLRIRLVRETVTEADSSGDAARAAADECGASDFSVGPRSRALRIARCGQHELLELVALTA